jgi:ketosteroid isomerase-like protein
MIPDPVDKPAPLHREESTTPDLVELGHRFFEAANRRDFDAMLSFFAPDVVWEARAFGITFEGVAAIRGFWEDWWASYEEFRFEQEEALDLGNGVAFAVVIMKGRLVGGSGEVQRRVAGVSVWVGSVIVRMTIYPDPDQARAAAERLAEERG